MHTKKINLTTFSHAVSSDSLCIRPDTEKELFNYLTTHQSQTVLARGAGLSYSDCCLNNKGVTINTQRFNHFISFEPNSGLVICQAGITFKELLSLHSEFIPPVIPGTLYATLGGALANDVHGKNNHQEKSFGHHVEWIELFIQNQLIRCSRTEYSDLFYATIGGLGLTGVITRLAVRLKKASHCVKVKNESFITIPSLLEKMNTEGLRYDYQVAWLDLLNENPRGCLSLANHIPSFELQEKKTYFIPLLPIKLIHQWNMKWFNSYYFHRKALEEHLSLEQFNNPLDNLRHWNRLYGKKGLLQFQAVFPTEHAVSILERLIVILRECNAVPTLAVLKLFTQPGEGLLSFCRPGITIAIDFINNQQAHQAIKKMNQFIVESQGRVYLAKDLLLTAEQYEPMYKHHANFAQLLADYHLPMDSNLARRLGIIK